MATAISVDLGSRSYEVRTGPGVLADLGDATRAAAGGQRAFVVSDETVTDLYAPEVCRSLEGAGYAVTSAIVPAGEQAKSLAQAERLYGELVAASQERTDPMVAVGGGVVGDLTGFVAGTYMRGVPFVQVPTTLLAQVDSSVGGKVAVNLPEGKNLVGVFWQPRLVLADVLTLDTLPARELVAGLAEVVKSALLAGGGFYASVQEGLNDMLAGGHEALEKAILGSVELKARIVQEDETEQGLRGVLNLGHTVGHALEQLAGYGELLHGEAVAIGIHAETHVAEAMGVSGAQEASDVRALVDGLGVKTPGDIDIDALITQMYRDKKARSGVLRFALLARPGEPELVEVPEDVVRRGLAALAA